MNLGELKAIINNCENKENTRICVVIDGDIKTCPIDIKSFGLYSDALTLNILVYGIKEEDKHD